MRWAKSNAVLRSPTGVIHWHLDKKEADLLLGLDGTTPPADSRRARALLYAAEEDGFLLGSVEPPPERALFQTTSFARLARWAYRNGLRFLFDGRRLLVLATAAVIPTLLVLARLVTGHIDPAVQNPVAEAVLIGVVLAIAGLLHELGHAAGNLRGGRNVGAAGFDLYLGSISFFVDSSDALMMGRRNRIVQALGGVAMELLVAGLLSVLVLLDPPAIVLSVSLRVIALLALGVVFNLLPVLQLDGYWLLADLLDRPRLSAEARTQAQDWLRARGQLPSPAAGYWFLSIIVGLVLTVLAIQSYVFVYVPLIVAAFDSGAVAAALLLLIMLPTVLAAVAALISGVGWLAESFQRRRVRAQTQLVVGWLNQLYPGEPLTKVETETITDGLIPYSEAEDSPDGPRIAIRATPAGGLQLFEWTGVGNVPDYFFDPATFDALGVPRSVISGQEPALV